MRYGPTAICCFVAATVTHYACAQEPVPVATVLVAEVLDKGALAEGKPLQRFTAAGTIHQGEVVYYTVKIRNVTTSPARDVEVIQRVPANTTYVRNSASGPSADITFSADNGRTFKAAKELFVTAPSGGTRPATVNDYTHIHWRLRNPLAPGAMALARFQAVFQ